MRSGIMATLHQLVKVRHAYLIFSDSEEGIMHFLFLLAKHSILKGVLK